MEAAFGPLKVVGGSRPTRAQAIVVARIRLQIPKLNLEWLSRSGLFRFGLHSVLARRDTVFNEGFYLTGCEDTQRYGPVSRTPEDVCH
ncbi:MAG: hypothetical protein JSV03_15975 [Planctomycetota bacterium]|nr:MAG: hypothetical protein JSV03_15975 [Planctomycetota bacterium]